MISPADKDLIQFVESADDAWKIVRDYIENNPIDTKPIDTSQGPQLKT